MRKMAYGIGPDGKLAAVVIVKDTVVRVMSEIPEIKQLNGQTLKRRRYVEKKGVSAQVFDPVEPGSPDYYRAMVDTLDRMGVTVTDEGEGGKP